MKNGNVIAHVGVDCYNSVNIDNVIRGIEICITKAKLNCIQIPKIFMRIQQWIEHKRVIKQYKIVWTEVQQEFININVRLLKDAFEFLHNCGMLLFLFYVVVAVVLVYIYIDVVIVFILYLLMLLVFLFLLSFLLVFLFLLSLLLLLLLLLI